MVHQKSSTRRKRDFEEWIPLLQLLLKQSFNHLPVHMYQYTNLHVAPTLPHKHTHTPKTKWCRWRVGNDPGNQGRSQALPLTLIVFLCKLTGGEQRFSLISALTIQVAVGKGKNCDHIRHLTTKTNLENHLGVREGSYSWYLKPAYNVSASH